MTRILNYEKPFITARGWQSVRQILLVATNNKYWRQYYTNNLFERCDLVGSACFALFKQLTMIKQSPPSQKRHKRPRPVHHASDFDLNVVDNDDDLFRWFLMTFLLGKPIQSSVAVKTWKLFVENKLDIPWAILNLKDRKLTALLRQGGYTRYQHVMTYALKTCMQQLIDGYEGSLMLMIELSETEDELSKRLQKLYGVGPKTAEIFMREAEEYFARRVE